MRRAFSAFAVLGALAAAPPAHAADAACWLHKGIPVVPAQVMGVAGDYILDTGALRTELAATQAQTAGFSETRLIGEVRLAGLRLTGRPVMVSDIDVRTGLFATPIAGVIGADVLGAYVLDIRYRPCRIRLSRPGRVHGVRSGAVLPFEGRSGAPVVAAAVSDGKTAWAGRFIISTGADRALRINGASARAPGAMPEGEAYPFGILVPRLRAFSLGGNLFENVEAGLLKADEVDADGVIGPGVLSRYQLRLDFPNRQMRLIPNEKGPPETGGP